MVSGSYVEDIAKAVRARVPADVVPDGDTDLLFLLYALLALSRGRETSPRNVHDAWAAWMTARGEKHQSVVPFDELPSSVKQEDQPFVVAIHDVARGLGPTGR